MTHGREMRRKQTNGNIFKLHRNSAPAKDKELRELVVSFFWFLVLAMVSFCFYWIVIFCGGGTPNESKMNPVPLDTRAGIGEFSWDGSW